jgi:hypothetical protein
MVETGVGDMGNYLYCLHIFLLISNCLKDLLKAKPIFSIINHEEMHIEILLHTYLIGLKNVDHLKC